MKNALILILAFALASCASSRRSTVQRQSRESVREERHRYENAPTVGMTKSQLLARYGKPRRRVLTEDGERWYYVLNASEVRRKALNPLVLTPPKYRSGVVLFDAKERVKRFSWDAKN